MNNVESTLNLLLDQIITVARLNLIRVVILEYENKEEQEKKLEECIKMGFLKNKEQFYEMPLKLDQQETIGLLGLLFHFIELNETTLAYVKLAHPRFYETMVKDNLICKQILSKKEKKKYEKYQS